MWTKIIFGLILFFSAAHSARVAFRLDMIRDYYLTQTNRAILSVFNETKTPITIGINGGVFGADVSFVNFIKNIMKDNSWEVEVAVNGYALENITYYTYLEQYNLFNNARTKIQQTLNPKTIRTAIPVFNDFNDMTINALRDLGFTHFSTATYTDPRNYGLDGRLGGDTTSSVRRFPVGAFTNDINVSNTTGAPANVTLAQIATQVANYGWANVFLSSEVYSIRNGNGFENQVNGTQLNELRNLLNSVRANPNYQIVPVGRLNFDAPPTALTGSADLPPANYSCDCIAFRLDDIQDGFVVPAQIEIMNLFQEYGVPLSIGIIANRFGTDRAIVNRVIDAIAEPDWCVEIVHHGYNHENFSTFSYEQQKFFLEDGNQKIKDVLGFGAVSWIPPFNEFNADTLRALKDSGFTHMSSQVEIDKGPLNLVNPDVWRFPKAAATNDEGNEIFFVGISAQETWKQVTDQLATSGFGVVMMHPQEFSESIQVGNVLQYTPNINRTQFNELRILLKTAKESGKKIVVLGEMNLYFPGQVPPTKCIHGYENGSNFFAPSLFVILLSIVAYFFKV